MKRCFCAKLLCVGMFSVRIHMFSVRIHMFSVRIHMFYSVRKCLDRESLCDDVFLRKCFVSRCFMR